MILLQAKRALLRWSIGDFKAPKGEEEQFSQKYWGVKTVEYVESLRKATEKSWKKIYLKTTALTNSQGIVGTEDPKHTDMLEQLVFTSGRAMCVDIDSDSAAEDSSEE